MSDAANLEAGQNSAEAPKNADSLEVVPGFTPDYRTRTPFLRNGSAIPDTVPSARLIGSEEYCAR